MKFFDMLQLTIGIVTFCFSLPAQAQFNFITPGQNNNNFVVPASTSLLQRPALLPGIVQPSSEQPTNPVLYNIGTYNLRNLPNLDISQNHLSQPLNQNNRLIIEEPAPEVETTYGILSVEKLPQIDENQDLQRKASNPILHSNGQHIEPLFFFPSVDEENLVQAENTLQNRVLNWSPKFKVYQAVPNNA